MAKRGGARPNSGRKPGSVASRSYKIAAEAIERGQAKGKLTPIEIMLENMWDAYDKAITNSKLKGPKYRALELAHRNRAQECAKDAAPYCHAKLSTMEVSGVNGEPMENKIIVEFVKSPHK